ncbi:MAG: Nitric oxide reductase [Candidatus Anoxychlamydiales bacterium]|uniref:Flavodoxin-like domain-containing protein n=1 Tax=marine sediment metagenome TaxID=412755 RepID=A0A0F9RC80_9ZZZZ|nr:Nitric oxide reductase [Candidatus Anoxychlamydiales bacterium]NGX40430.1 Nitric oxide reductase [Candidatus Anoxychlamydiales bacterium]HEU64219.1 FprA family A-type flavoprotein [Chlamydiota bacterium]
MRAFEIKKGIYWVGAIDWELSEFHGYLTQRGSTYNAYLIIDEKIVLVDTVKSHVTDDLISRIKTIIDPSKIDIIISNHTEMDHSGSIPAIMKYSPNATVVCSPMGEKGLKKHFDATQWKFKVVETGDKINIGKRDLSFILMQMVHWPDSMATYCLQEKLLMPNDIFGQHMASYERFVDENRFDVVMEEAKKYFANILLPYSRQSLDAVTQIEKLSLDMIAPSHGLIWRGDDVKKILKAYDKWDANITVNKAVIVYDTMWGSTKEMATSIYKAFEAKNINVEIKNLRKTHISDIMTDIIDAKYICVGSPTLNNTMMPTVASFLYYLKGLRPQNRIAIAFGSYGWGGQSLNEIEKVFEFLKYQTLDTIKFEYVPRKADLEKMTEDLKNKLG